MTNSTRLQFHSSMAKSLVNDIQYQKSSLYYFLGKLNSWGPLDTPGSDAIPQTTEQNTSIRDNIAFMKRVGANDVSVMCTRHDWTTGIVYTQWDHTVDMSSETFYVINSFNQVFKCLFNNHDSASTVMPAGNSYSPFGTADGYLWKYMYTVPDFKMAKFANSNYMPVQTAITDSFYSTGSVDSIIINDVGSGYTNSLVTYITASASAGSGAILIPKVSSITGSIVGVTIVNGGSGYTSAPTLAVHMLSGYTSGTNKYPENNSAGTALLTAIVSEGVVVGVMIVDPGINYPNATTTTISVSGDGTDMELHPIVYGGQIVDVVIDNSGSGYTFANITVNGAGNGANLTPLFATSDFVSNQNIVEQSAIDGALYAINITNGGTGYTNTTVADIVGDGIGATARVTVIDGVIVAVRVSDYGAGYTYANVVFSDINRELGNVVDATAYVTLPPIGGHGADAIKELYGRTVALVSSIKTDILADSFNQDYRQYGLIKSPKNLDKKPATVGRDYSAYQVTFNTVANLAVDDVLLYEGTKSFMVVKISGYTVWLQPLSRTATNPVGNFSKGTNLYVSSNLTVSPVINKYSGDLLYTSYELPFVFSQTQGLNIKTYISF